MSSQYYKKVEATHTALEMVAVALEYDKRKDNEEFKEKFPTAESFLKSDKLHTYNIDCAQAGTFITDVSQRLVMMILKNGKLSPYLTSLNEMIADPAALLPDFRMGLLASAPKIYADLVSKDEIYAMAYNSEYVGTPGEKIEVSLRILSCKLINWEGGNFYNAVACSDKVKAKVKKHDNDRFLNSSMVTYLNYVKVLE